MRVGIHKISVFLMGCGVLADGLVQAFAHHHSDFALTVAAVTMAIGALTDRQRRD